MKNESGYGSVSLIYKKDKRRKPYRVQIHVGWTNEGKPLRKTIGYARTRSEGRQMLAEYHDKPFDLDMNNVSFKFLYDKWFEYKKTTGISEVTLKKYIYYRKHYNIIENKPFIEITRTDLQDIIDNINNHTAGYQDSIRNLYHQLYEYAKGNNIKVGADISKFVNIKKGQSSTLHQPFTDEELSLLWAHRNEIIDIILINIYTGLRPGEFFKISEIHDDYFVTGSKTESGKNRVIPLNNKIKDMFHEIMKSNILKEIATEDRLYHRYKRNLKNIGLDSHSPYDCRHTFATLMSNAKADEHCVKLIMGHKISDITKRVYTHKVIEQLIDEVNKI
ncbi:MAG: tyrosine-type recombinase/integrase [Bacilli bacterium]|nr:tyrosine-type recombinase/integrase [Bacilli bacterium]